MWVDNKIPGFVIFYAETIKKTDSLRNSDEVAWYLAISEANLCRASQNSFYKIFLKNFVKFTKKDLFQSLFFLNIQQLWKKTLTQVFLFEFWNFLKTIFLQNAFRSLLLLLEKSLRNPWEITTRPTTRMLLQ